MEGMLHSSANYNPLSPITFLERAALIYGDRVSIIFDGIRFTWRETHQRCLKLASALSNLKVSRGDIIAALAPNVPELYELHFAVPMAGAVLSPLNPKLDPSTLALILQQLQPRFIFVDYMLSQVVLKAFEFLSLKKLNLAIPILIPSHDQQAIEHNAHQVFDVDFNGLLEMGKTDGFAVVRPESECDPITINYTSGSTGDPKGVVYSHRATYLNSLAAILRFNLTSNSPVLLWTVDMFRCNGWCLPWAMAALGGTNICLRSFSVETIFGAICSHQVTHLCGPPSILNMIANGPTMEPVIRRVDIVVAGPLPPEEVLNKVERLGFVVSLGYGMTEALGPAIVQRPWRCQRNSSSSRDENGKITNCDDHEGLQSFMIQNVVDVKDPTTMQSVPWDGETIGEVMFKGNILMSGYFKNPKATQEAFNCGWFRTGDLGVRQQCGYIQIKDRAKHMIFSSGTRVSTMEVEAVLLSHPKVLEAAVVGAPDEHLGEVPCAFVKLKEGTSATSEEIIKFCGKFLETYMVPQAVTFGDLPINSTGKIQKSVLKVKAAPAMSRYPTVSSQTTKIQGE